MVFLVVFYPSINQIQSCLVFSEQPSGLVTPTYSGKESGKYRNLCGMLAENISKWTGALEFTRARRILTIIGDAALIYGAKKDY